PRRPGGARRGRHDPPSQHRRGDRGVRRLRAPALRVPGPAARHQAQARHPSLSFLPYAVAVWVCMVGLYGIVTSRHLIHTIVFVSVVRSSTYVLLLAVGYREGGAAPVFIDIPRDTPAVDPVVQALTLTDV